MGTASSVRRALFWLGLVPLFAGVALTALFLPLIAVGGPLFLLGLVLVWVSGQPVWAKLLASVAPFVSWLAVGLGALALAPRGPATTFLIPEGYEGQIVLVLGEPCGQAPEKEAGRLVYRVPANGVVVTQNKPPAHAPTNTPAKRI